MAADCITDTRRNITTLSTAISRIHRYLPMLARVRGMAAISVMFTSNARSTCHLPTFSPSRRTSRFPPVLRPRLTSAPSATALKAAPLHPATRMTHWDRSPQIRTFTFPLPPPHLHTGRFGGTGFTICCWLTPTGMPSMRFVSLGAGICLRLPSHPISR